MGAKTISEKKCFPILFQICQNGGEVGLLPIAMLYSGWGCLAFVTLPADLIIAFFLSRKTIKIFEEETLTSLSLTVIFGMFSIAANWICGIGFICSCISLIMSAVRIGIIVFN